ncbi:hypothetical protein BUALT_Bualt02G0168500 [Buddleja alternifolia]|uniref:FAR1 domain-containing protein n=1 Tax=Buddleja alternifolia TaxID=168488 RepID=A0AAV6Y0W6_9LAMI|nr:hypothetical protein BUALT_Bualt02G0168500 [Buddleja alternifolia]
MVEGNDVDLERSEWISDHDLEDDDFVEAKDNKIQVKGGEVLLKPFVGMEFESEDDVRRFYNEYARRVGFLVRIMQRRHSEIDGRTLSRRLGCNKQGFSPNPRSNMGPEEKPRPGAREGCKATIQFKLEKSGKWVVTRFVEEHNHPLGVSVHQHTNLHDKDKNIQELSRELHRHEDLCATYRERLIDTLANVEKQSEHLSWKVLAVVQNVREAEAEALMFSAA